jgi:hypothetical protein
MMNRLKDTNEQMAAIVVTANDHKPDQQVYALYGLTPEEIKIVEESVKQ